VLRATEPDDEYAPGARDPGEKGLNQ
jgi:hypothetical protein